jgi:hypothetical protein
MKMKLFSELMQFAFSKKKVAERLKYIWLGIIYFVILYNNNNKSKSNSSASESASGDDIYPLF